MAIDTREKRQAAAVISHYFMGPNVTPNAAKDQEWRQEAAWGYPGILAGGATPTAVRLLPLTGAGAILWGFYAETLVH